MGQVIQLIIKDFDLEIYFDCCFDVLEVLVEYSE